MAEALRDLADEIEKGTRVVLEIHTTELIVGAQAKQSLLFIKSSIVVAKK
jgi:hypothetical protein